MPYYTVFFHEAKKLILILPKVVSHFCKQVLSEITMEAMEAEPMEVEVSPELTPEQIAQLQLEMKQNEVLMRPVKIQIIGRDTKLTDETLEGIEYVVPYGIVSKFEAFKDMLEDVSDDTMDVSIPVKMNKEDWEFFMQLLGQLQFGVQTTDEIVLAERQYEESLQEQGSKKQKTETNTRKNDEIEKVRRDFTDFDRELMGNLPDGRLIALATLADGFRQPYCLDKLATLLGERVEQFIDAREAEACAMEIGEEKKCLKGKELTLYVVKALFEAFAKEQIDEEFDLTHFEEEWKEHEWYLQYKGWTDKELFGVDTS